MGLCWTLVDPSPGPEEIVVERLREEEIEQFLAEEDAWAEQLAAWGDPYGMLGDDSFAPAFSGGPIAIRFSSSPAPQRVI